MIMQKEILLKQLADGMTIKELKQLILQITEITSLLCGLSHHFEDLAGYTHYECCFDYADELDYWAEILYEVLQGKLEENDMPDWSPW